MYKRWEERRGRNDFLPNWPLLCSWLTKPSVSNSRSPIVLWAFTVSDPHFQGLWDFLVSGTGRSSSSFFSPIYLLYFNCQMDTRSPKMCRTAWSFWTPYSILRDSLVRHRTKKLQKDYFPWREVERRTLYKYIWEDYQLKIRLQLLFTYTNMSPTEGDCLFFSFSQTSLDLLLCWFGFLSEPFLQTHPFCQE